MGKTEVINESSEFKVIVLPTQEDIANYENGVRPGNFFTHTFHTKGELDAYKDGINAIGDEFDEVAMVKADGCDVIMQLDDEDTPSIVHCHTPAEAEAYVQGVEDAEGFAAPLVTDETDVDFEAMEELIAIPSPKP